MREKLLEIETGKRTICGTDWPVEDQLHRTGKREWTVTRGVCNGFAESAEIFRSKKAALAAVQS